MEFDRMVEAKDYHDFELAGVGLFLHVGGMAAALNHESVDDAVEDRTVIKTFFCILDEVSYCRRSSFLVKVDNDVAFRGNDFNFRSSKANSRGSQHCGAESQFFDIKHGVKS